MHQPYIIIEYLSLPISTPLHIDKPSLLWYALPYVQFFLLSHLLAMKSRRQSATAARRMSERRGSGKSSRRPSIDPSRLVPMDKSDNFLIFCLQAYFFS